MMHYHSDESAQRRRRALNKQTIDHVEVEILHGLLATELIRLEEECHPGGDWRLRLERVEWCTQLAAEIRRRGNQLRLG